MPCHFSGAAIATPQMGQLKQQPHFLTVLDAGSVRSRGGQEIGHVLGCLLCVFTCFSPRVSFCPVVLIVQGHRSQWIMAQPSGLIQHDLSEAPLSKYSHILSSWGLGLQHVKLEGPQFRPQKKDWEEG